jgi:patatin-like phospholipase/acyl hydrolase
MPFQILSLSGGGYLGYYTAAVLTGLETKVRWPIARCFDLLAGTSVGGMIALCLAREIPTERICAAFEAHGTKIFSSRPKSRGVVGAIGDFARSAFTPAGNGEALRETAVELLGPSTRLGDLAHPVMVTSVDLSSGAARLFSSHDEKDRKLLAVDVALATSAVPTYFPMIRIGKGLFADGGLFANAPDLQALHEAEVTLGVPAGQVRMLSVGTTSAHYAIPQKRTKLGAIDWLTDKHLLRISMAAQQTSVDSLMRGRLGDHYLRIDQAQSSARQHVLDLDVATPEATRILGDMARHSVASLSDDAHLARLLKHEAPPAR